MSLWGERRLDTNVDGDAQGVMGREVGKLATSILLVGPFL